jgi:hypothetical protein
MEIIEIVQGNISLQQRFHFDPGIPYRKDTRYPTEIPQKAPHPFLLVPPAGHCFQNPGPSDIVHMAPK